MDSYIYYSTLLSWLWQKEISDSSYQFVLQNYKVTSTKKNGFNESKFYD